MITKFTALCITILYLFAFLCISGCVQDNSALENQLEEIEKVQLKALEDKFEHLNRKYYYYCIVSGHKVWNRHIDESVFALSFKENLAVFNERREER